MRHLVIINGSAWTPPAGYPATDRDYIACDAVSVDQLRAEGRLDEFTIQPFNVTCPECRKSDTWDAANDAFTAFGGDGV